MLSNTEQVNRAQRLVDDIIKLDVQNAADINHTLLLFDAASKKGVKIPDARYQQLRDLSLRLTARQEKLKDQAKKNGWTLKLANAPASAKKFVEGVASNIQQAGASAWNKVKGWFSGLGAEPVTISLTTIVVGSLVLGAAAAYIFFGPVREDAAKDSRSVTQLRNYIEDEVKAGRLKREDADAIYTAVTKYGNDAYNQGKKKQWWVSNKGWLKTIGLVGGTTALIFWGIPALNEKFKTKK